MAAPGHFPHGMCRQLELQGKHPAVAAEHMHGALLAPQKKHAVEVAAARHELPASGGSVSYAARACYQPRATHPISLRDGPHTPAPTRRSRRCISLTWQDVSP